MPHGIYPADLALELVDQAGQKYRPSNGTEGEIFIGSWCFECERDKHQDCPIVAATFRHDVHEPEYPQESQYGPDGQPLCTAFVHLGDPIPPPRCTETADMFGQGGAPCTAP